MALLGTITVLSLAFLTGNELCVGVFVEPTLRSLPDAQQVAIAPAFAARLGKFMPPWYALTLLRTAVTGFMRDRQGAGGLNGAGVSLRCNWSCSRSRLRCLSRATRVWHA